MCHFFAAFEPLTVALFNLLLIFLNTRLDHLWINKLLLCHVLFHHLRILMTSTCSVSRLSWALHDSLISVLSSFLRINSLLQKILLIKPKISLLLLIKLNLIWHWHHLCIRWLTITLLLASLSLQHLSILGLATRSHSLLIRHHACSCLLVCLHLLRFLLTCHLWLHICTTLSIWSLHEQKVILDSHHLSELNRQFSNSRNRPDQRFDKSLGLEFVSYLCIHLSCVCLIVVLASLLLISALIRHLYQKF